MKLADIIDTFITGDWGEESPTQDTPNAAYCVRGADIVPITNHNFTDIPQRYVCDRTKETKLLVAGDLVIEKSGGSPTQSTGRIVYVSEDLIKAKGNVVSSNFCTAFRVKAGWNPLYVYYFWQNVYNHGAFFNFEGKTSGIKNLQLDNALSAIDIEYLPLEKQNQIVASLASIDEKLKVNRQINDNLEAMAKQLYDYWFVQFDFPNKEGKPYKSSGGAMVWNDKLKREIPQGWSNGVLSDVANITMGQSPDGSSYNEDGEGIIFYQGSTDFGLRFPDIRQYTTSPSRYANKGDILMSVRAPVGALNIANNDCCIGRGLSALSSKIGSMTHLYYLMNDFRLKFEGMNSAGTTFGSITKDELFSLPVIIPTKSVISEFEQVCEPIFDKQMIIGEEINALTKQRDELLPLLMNGQASVNYHLSAKAYPLPIAYKKAMPIEANQIISSTFIQKSDSHTPSPRLQTSQTHCS